MRPSTYIVASTPRSGSSLLCEGLQASGVAGRPAETFAPAFEGMWNAHWSLPEDRTFADFLRAALAYGTTPNGVYGLKIHWGHLPQLAHRTGVAGEPSLVLEALFPGAVFVNIIREDRRAQALSLFRAMATNEWCRFAGSEPPQGSAEAITLDRDVVRRLETAIEAQQLQWTAYFRRKGIVPLIVQYQCLTNDYRGQIGRVLEFLGLDASGAATIPEPRLVRQSDQVNARWRRAMDELEAVENKHDVAALNCRR